MYLIIKGLLQSKTFRTKGLIGIDRELVTVINVLGATLSLAREM